MLGSSLLSPGLQPLFLALAFPPLFPASFSRASPLARAHPSSCGCPTESDRQSQPSSQWGPGKQKLALQSSFTRLSQRGSSLFHVLDQLVLILFPSGSQCPDSLLVVPLEIYRVPKVTVKIFLPFVLIYSSSSDQSPLPVKWIQLFRFFFPPVQGPK